MKWLLPILIFLRSCEWAPAATIYWTASEQTPVVYLLWELGCASPVYTIHETGPERHYDIGNSPAPRKFFVTVYNTATGLEGPPSNIYYTRYLRVDLLPWESGWIEVSEDLVEWTPFQPVFYGGSFNFPIEPDVHSKFYRFKPDDA